MTTMTGSDKETLVAAADLLKRVADRLRAVASTLPGDKPLRAEIADLGGAPGPFGTPGASHHGGHRRDGVRRRWQPQAAAKGGKIVRSTP